MKLTDLNPIWISHGGEGISDEEGNPIPLRERVGVIFDCPCGTHGEDADHNRVYIPFSNPPDGGPPVKHGWDRSGDTFETLTLRPSILRMGGCGWHGFVTNGEISTTGDSGK